MTKMEDKMGSIEVVNKHKMVCDSPNDVYVGRGSPLGNPFRIAPGFNRKKVIELYEIWLEQQIQQDNVEVIIALNLIARQVTDGKNVRLVCFCKPKDCHGDVIKARVELALKRMEVT